MISLPLMVMESAGKYEECTLDILRSMVQSGRGFCIGHGVCYIVS